MNILVVTKHLDEYAGSELFTRDLCFGLLRVGHAVAAYAWEPGAVSAEMAEEGIEVVSDIRALSGPSSPSTTPHSAGNFGNT